MNNTENDNTLKKELNETIKNTAVNFKFFEFKTYSTEERNQVVKFPFPKYRSFETHSAVLFYKHISRLVNF